MPYVCSKCDKIPGEMTQEMVGIAGTSCVCGGKLEQIDEDIFKAFMPFAPTSEPLFAKGHRWGWMMKMIGFDNMKKVAAMPPEQRLALIDELRQTAARNGTQDAYYSGPDFSAAEGVELLK
jgi:hypothetical protein